MTWAKASLSTLSGDVAGALPGYSWGKGPRAYPSLSTLPERNLIDACRMATMVGDGLFVFTVGG